jgi:hypothetical protein
MGNYLLFIFKMFPQKFKIIFFPAIITMSKESLFILNLLIIRIYLLS